jgi:hypothetical protein
MLVYLTCNVAWCTRYVIIFMDDNADNADVPRVKKTQMQRYIYAWQDTMDGPLEIILQEESMWYPFYVHNFYIHKDAKLQKAFCTCFRLPYQQFLTLLETICKDKLFVRWCGYKKNNKKVLPVELFVLVLLRYLGCGWTFDDYKVGAVLIKN